MMAQSIAEAKDACDCAELECGLHFIHKCASGHLSDAERQQMEDDVGGAESDKGCANKCVKKTTGTCRVFSCSSSRNADCEDGVCTCGEGDCVNDDGSSA